MRYVVIDNVAVLASRSVEKITDDVTVTVSGVPDKATLYLISEKGENSFLIENQKAVIPNSVLKEGIFGVTVLWTTTSNDVATQHEAHGNEFKVFNDGETLAIVPAPLASATELENMWQGIINTLDVLVPFIEAYKHGYEVV